MAKVSLTVAVAASLVRLPLGASASEAGAAPEVTPPAAIRNAAPARPDEPIDEIIVQGTRLWHLRKAVVDADDRFFARYNQLNKNHDFDVHCDMEASIGTRIEQRTCRAVFQARAEFEWARALLQGTAAIPPEIVRLDRADEYRKNLLEVTRSDPELLKLVRQRDALEKKYQAELKKRMKGKWILFE